MAGDRRVATTGAFLAGPASSIHALTECELLGQRTANCIGGYGQARNAAVVLYRVRACVRGRRRSSVAVVGNACGGAGGPLIR